MGRQAAGLNNKQKDARTRTKIQTDKRTYTLADRQINRPEEKQTRRQKDKQTHVLVSLKRFKIALDLLD